MKHQNTFVRKSWQRISQINTVIETLLGSKPVSPSPFWDSGHCDDSFEIYPSALIKDWDYPRSSGYLKPFLLFCLKLGFWKSNFPIHFLEQSKQNCTKCLVSKYERTVMLTFRKFALQSEWQNGCHFTIYKTERSHFGTLTSNRLDFDWIPLESKINWMEQEAQFLFLPRRENSCYYSYQWHWRANQANESFYIVLTHQPHLRVALNKRNFALRLNCN